MFMMATERFSLLLLFGLQQLLTGKAVGRMILLALIGTSVISVVSEEQEQGTVEPQEQQQQPQCFLPKRSFNGMQSVFRVSVLAIRGYETAMRESGPTFTEYLSTAVGHKFTPPIQFETLPVNFDEVMDQATALPRQTDFLHLNPSMYSCVESEIGSNSLVSKISKRVVGGITHELTEFAGVIFTRADNNEINTTQDIRDKSVACVAITGLGSGQMQFRELQIASVHHFQDVKQILFTAGQGKVVSAVLNGLVDIGFVRTDQLERSIDPATGELLDLSKVKIISGNRKGASPLTTSDGEVFPFQASTRLYPEWNVASLAHVPDVVAREVQSALLDMEKHAAIVPHLVQCYEERRCNYTDYSALGTLSLGNATDIENLRCMDSCFSDVDGMAFETCETTRTLATLAYNALVLGKYAGWRSTLSYMELRNMQEEIHFIHKEEKSSSGSAFIDDSANVQPRVSLDVPAANDVKCVRASNIADAVVCPEGHFKKSRMGIENGCEAEGLSCHGYKCLCRPCVKAFEVDFYPLDSSAVVERSDDQAGKGCSKFAVCGEVEQASNITFLAVDNKARNYAVFTARVLIGDSSEDYSMKRLQNGIAGTATGTAPGELTAEITSVAHQFVFDATLRRVGVVIVEVYADGAQINESPFRLQVIERDCRGSGSDGDSTHGLRVADATGTCVCSSNSVDMSGRGTCVLLSVLLPSIFIPITILAALIVRWYVAFKRNQSDSVWKVDPAELIFTTPPTVLGRGTFGLVLLAQYRGTNVAVKRALPPPSPGTRASGNRTVSYEQQHNRKVVDDSKGGQLPALARKQPSKSQSSPPPSPLGKKGKKQHPGKSSETEPPTVDDVEAQQQEDVSQLTPAQRALQLRAERMKDAAERGPSDSDSSGSLMLREKIHKRLGGEPAMESTEVDSKDVKQKQEPPNVRKSKGVTDRRSKTQKGENRFWTQYKSAGFNDPTGDEHNDGEDKATALTLQNSFFDFDDDSDFVRSCRSRPSSVSSRLVTPGNATSGETESHQDLALPEDFGLQTGAHFLNYAFSTIIGSQSGRNRGNDVGSGWAGVTRKTTGSHPSSRRRLFLFGRNSDAHTRLQKEFIEEMRILSKLRHPCITTVMGAVLTKNKEPMLVMEHMELGSLYDLLHNDTMVIDGEVVLPVLRDITQGVRFLHAATPRVIHGDLKSQNVLVDSKFRAKVADFGLSQKKRKQNYGAIGYADLIRRVGGTTQQTIASGTPLWMAPELLRREIGNTTESDIYSFGIVLYEVFSRKDPYEGENHVEVLRQVADKIVEKRPPVPTSCPQRIAELMVMCLKGDPSERPTAKDIDVCLKLLDADTVDPVDTADGTRANSFPLPSSSSSTKVAPQQESLMSKQLHKTKEQTTRTEDLLFKLFPRYVAESLRDGRKVEPVTHSCVTVLFADIVGFTEISSRLTPYKVSDLLDRLYTKFDKLCGVHDVFKVETIGDSYMAVTNLDTDQTLDHVIAMVNFAFDAIDAASYTAVDTSDTYKGFVKIRCGFHCGSVVASVCGSRTPRYTLIGDTVNTASRMESNSLAGRIHCSEVSADLLHEQLQQADADLINTDCQIVPRGGVRIKGKGEMYTYWIMRKTDDDYFVTSLSSLNGDGVSAGAGGDGRPPGGDGHGVMLLETVNEEEYDISRHASSYSTDITAISCETMET